MDTLNPSKGVDMSNAPGADLSFSDLFSPEETVYLETPAQPATETLPAVPAVQPAVTPPAEPYVYTYKSREEAETGIAQKDAIIEKLRQEAIQRTGIDPVTNQPVVRPQTPAEPHSYLRDPKSLYVDLGNLHASGDQEGWTRKLGEFVGEYVGQVLAPAAPLVLDSAKDRAIRGLEEKVPEFRKFLSSSEYKETLEDLPKLKMAIGIAESNLEAAPQLPEFYRLAYFAAQGRNASKPQPAQPVVAQPRTTVPTTTVTPPNPADVQKAPDMNTSEGRKAFMESFKQRGLDKLPIR